MFCMKVEIFRELDMGCQMVGLCQGRYEEFWHVPKPCLG